MKFFNKTFFSIIFFIFFLEFFFQLIFILNIGNTKKLILFYNPYCDENYWKKNDSFSFDTKKFTQHSTLSVIKRENEKYYEKKIIDNQKKDNVFYGSSFIDHDLFRANIKSKYNYALKSYGLDQIYLSYTLTKNNHKGDNIIIGFLPEDLDRSIFSKREYDKIKFVKSNEEFILTNHPVKNRDHFVIDFLTYKFLKNIFFLVTNEYDYKKSECEKKNKIELFNFFLLNIIKDTKNLNQNLTIVLFQFKENMENNSNWRYEIMDNFFKRKKIQYIDTKKLFKKDSKYQTQGIDIFFNKEDKHYSKYGFKITYDEINKVIEQYK